ncbi:MAG: phosphoribosylanthranilate isomerase [Halofilum sp. (in: g-proteobacteria)]|nr:phosphoribosylanthranilate isomerase [Halofilum sp. (in: g-proteobacteria)]
MGYTRIKICGVTRPDDARAAAAAGADAVGLVFHPPSSRALELEAALAVVAALPPFVTTVGLFLDPEAERVRSVLERVELDLLQFHGSEPAEFCASFGRPYIKAVSMAGGEDPAALAAAHPAARGVLADSHVAGQAGGTGKAFAWERLPRQREYRLILAGGLTPDNAAEAVRQVRPDAVDVSSGVEQAPGVKDHARVRRFIEEVRSGDRSEA